MKYSLTIAGLFHRIASENPGRPALIDGDTRYSYEELASLSSAYARLFVNRLGLKPGQVLVARLDNSPELVAGFLAVAQIGAAVFPMNIHWRRAEVHWFLDRLPVAGVFTKRSLKAGLDVFDDNIAADRVIAADDPEIRAISLKGRGTCDPIKAEPQLVPEQPVVLFSSSGSSGVPKIVPRSDKNLIEGILCEAGVLGIMPGDKFLSIVPFYHGNGFDNSLMLPLLSGATAVLQPDFIPLRFTESMKLNRIDVLIGSPAIFELFLRFGMDADCLSTLRICASSGGLIAAKNVEAIKERFGVTIRQIYGSSETGVMAIDPPEGGPAMIPLPNMNLNILGPLGEPLPPGEAGEIAVMGPSVSREYIGGSGGDSMAFREGYYCTGDSGSLDAEGKLTLLGRIRPIINLSGTKVDPTEVENAIRSMPAISACRVFSIMGSQHKAMMKAVIAVREGEELVRSDIVAHCRTLLAEYKIPRIIDIVPSMPSDLSGKSRIPWVETEN